MAFVGAKERKRTRGFTLEMSRTCAESSARRFLDARYDPVAVRVPFSEVVVDIMTGSQRRRRLPEAAP
jgi:hypothetical protein